MLGPPTAGERLVSCSPRSTRRFTDVPISRTSLQETSHGHRSVAECDPSVTAPAELRGSHLWRAQFEGSRSPGPNPKAQLFEPHVIHRPVSHDRRGCWPFESSAWNQVE